MNKRLMALLTAACLLLGGTAMAEEPTPTAEADAASEYQPLHISLWGNPSSGYEWTCEYENNGVLEAPMQEFVEDEHEEGAVGVGGNFDFYFGIRGPGKAQIIFNYGVSWGVSVPEETVICSVTVDENGESSVRWAEMYTGDQTLMVVLPSNPTTGWDWSYQADDSGIVTLTSENYTALSEDLAGAGGSATYLFRIEKSGDTVLMFNYANMWDPYATAEETYAVTLSVNEAMEVSMTVDG